MTTSPPRSASRLPWLDGLRGAAALAVLWHHFYVVVLHGFPADGALRQAWAVRVWMDFGRWGSLGVPVFFVLSGFCVGQTWQRAATWQDFAWRRFRRIFPAYFASLALGITCALIARLSLGVNDVTAHPPLTVGAIAATLTILTTPATSTPLMSWVYWSLTYEVAFYLVLATALVLPARLRLPGLVLIGALASALAFAPTTALRPGPLFWCDLWPLFGLGLALALWPGSPRSSVLTALPAVIALGAVAVNPLYPGFLIAGLLAALLTGLVAQGVGLPCSRALEWIGTFSYSLYLTHLPIVLLLSHWLIKRPNQTPTGLFAGCALLTLCTLTVAWLFFRWFERPWLRPSRMAVGSSSA